LANPIAESEQAKVALSEDYGEVAPPDLSRARRRRRGTGRSTALGSSDINPFSCIAEPVIDHTALSHPRIERVLRGTWAIRLAAFAVRYDDGSNQKSPPNGEG
jgi:hypothetical protein